MASYRARTEWFIHRRIAGEDYLISIGAGVEKFNGTIALNETAACLWDAMKAPKTVAELNAALEQQFTITAEEAAADTAEFLQQLREADMVECLE